MKKYKFAIIGAGAAGMAAADEISRSSPDSSCIIIERDSQPGGILLQCIHTGFGLQYFKKELTGPEYAVAAFRKLQSAGKNNLEFRFNTTAIAVEKNKTLICSDRQGQFKISCEILIIATGSREIPFGALGIPSHRPAGIFGAGEAQLLINRHAMQPGRTGVILGAGDIGLIMARRLIYEGIQVAAVIELKKEPGGVKRNIQTCIEDLGIQLLTSSTIVRVHGKNRVEGVTVARVDESGQPQFNETRFVACDFLLTAVGLMPEIQLARDAGACSLNGHLQINENGRSNLQWLYACGNAAKIFPIVDEVSISSEKVIKKICEGLNL